MTPSPMNLRRSLSGLLALLLILALSACASSGSSSPAAGGGFAGAADVAGAGTVVAKPAGQASDYRIGPQDLLEISVFQVADLSRTVRVNTGGDISLPLVGLVHAGGQTVGQVEEAIAAKLTQTYLQNPQVSVFVKEFSSQRVTLEGNVAKPGIYPLTGDTTLLQTIALGGGLNEMADPSGILIFRVIDGKKKVARFDLKQIRQGNAEDPAIHSDDIVVVSESDSKSMFAKLTKALPVLGIFSFF